MPECISSLGEPMAPEQTMTSRLACTLKGVRLVPETASTPTARLPCTSTRSAWVCSWMVRLGRRMRTGSMKPVAADARRAFHCVSW
ncbi:MAG: hypothetical protein GAK34_03565 [Delftia tsuruhatensis]|nr:MAG: hypothetical protein GAK34_03565 [Delftia tsuruhatensis]